MSAGSSRTTAAPRTSTAVAAKSSVRGAVQTIVIADAVMGVDNVLAVGGAAHGSLLLVLIGLAVSIPIVIWGSTLVLKWVERYPAILWLGAAVLGWTAAKMIASEPLLAGTLHEHRWLRTALYAAIVGGLVAAPVWRCSTVTSASGRDARRRRAWLVDFRLARRAAERGNRPRRRLAMGREHRRLHPLDRLDPVVIAMQRWFGAPATGARDAALARHPRYSPRARRERLAARSRSGLRRRLLRLLRLLRFLALPVAIAHDDPPSRKRSLCPDRARGGIAAAASIERLREIRDQVVAVLDARPTRG